jgi:S1-C subfamily serine protease
MVKIYTVRSQPNYFNPWDMYTPSPSTGSGCVIGGNLILTNAHVVSDQTFIQVRLHGRSERHRAQVVAVSHEADLALLTVVDPTFFEGITPLPFGDLPEVQQGVVVYGFPKGGDTLSATEGVVSRIEHQTYAHSDLDLLAVQLDAAVNSGNSGGPVMLGDRVVGVVMQSFPGADNIGYMVPSPVLYRFLKDLADGTYHGIPSLGIRWQRVENEDLKRMLGLQDDQSGVLVTVVLPGMPAEGKLREGDVVRSVDGHAVAGDGTVEFRPHERTSMNYYVQQHQVGDAVTVGILREGENLRIPIQLDKTLDQGRLVPADRYDVRPTYYVYGGLVFSSLTTNYLKLFGDKWYNDGPTHLLDLRKGFLSAEGEEVVLLVKVLASEVNTGYHNIFNGHITEVNGQRVKNLRHLIQLVENDTDEPFVVFKGYRRSIVVLDRKKAELENPKILETYGIPSDRSEDLKGVESRFVQTRSEPSNQK